MLQQTQVQTVLPYYQAWMQQFPDVHALARASLQKVLKAWQGLGYYARVRNLRRAAQVIVENFGGTIPARYEDLRRLPGFGPYTTAAVLSFAFDAPYPVIDTNVRRVLMRLGGIKGRPEATRDKALLSFLGTFFPARESRQFNQAMMELGALVCRHRNPLCLVCPVQASCLAFKHGEQDIILAPRSRRPERLEAVVAIIQEDGKYLIQKRPEGRLLAGLWEFPGGKRISGETLVDALRREVREELGAEIEGIQPLLEVEHAYTRFQVKLYAYACRLQSRSQPGKKALRWVSLRSLKKYPFPSGSAKIIRYLEEQERLSPAASQRK